MKCPACKKVDLQERTLKNRLEIDACPSCRGNWLDGGELQRLTKNPGAANQAIELLLSDAGPTDRDCPRCKVSIVTGNFSELAIELDFCKDCSGLWFDAGELKRVVKFIQQKSVPDDQTATPEQCPDCSANCPASAALCIDCGYDFRSRVVRQTESVRELMIDELGKLSRRYFAFRDCLMFASVILAGLSILCLYKTTSSSSEFRWIPVEGTVGRGGYERRRTADHTGREYIMFSAYFRYSYSANAKQYRGSYHGPEETFETAAAAPTMGTKLPVFYNPNDPSESTLYPKASVFEGWWKVILATALSVLCGVAFVLCPSHDVSRSGRRPRIRRRRRRG